MKPDIIVTWPNNCDYPLWRQFIRDNGHRFNKVIIGIMETNQYPRYTDFVIDSMLEDNVLFFNAPLPTPGTDWRNLAVNKALQFVTSEWVWFTEQDFEVTQSFWHDVESKAKNHDVIGVYQGDRLHPCCLFATVDAINKTNRDFGIVPNVSDHFSLFAQDLKRNGVEIATIKKATYYHHNGLSSNFTLLSNGLQPNHAPTVFAEYIAKSLRVDVPISDQYRKIANSLLPQDIR